MNVIELGFTVAPIVGGSLVGAKGMAWFGVPGLVGGVILSGVVGILGWIAILCALGALVCLVTRTPFRGPPKP